MAIDWRIRALHWYGTRAGRAFRPDLTVEAFRAGHAQMNRQLGLRERGAVDERELAIPTDAGPIHARLYRAAGTAAPLPLLIYFHGGGFVIGDVPSYGHLTRFFALHSGCAVLSVGYRLAPEFRFPRGHEDAFAAYGWALRHADELGIDRTRVAVAGDSAGGNLAADIGAFAAERGLPTPAYQLLIYPFTDGTASQPSRTRYDRGAPFTPAVADWFHRMSAIDDADLATPLFAPLLVPSVAASPPTYVLAAGYDPLVDEGRAYAEKLRAQGVPVTYDVRPTLTHGFVSIAGVVPEARRALLAGAHAVREALTARAEAA
jgi:acetyl esterase